jgi:hypothetical protein
MQAKDAKGNNLTTGGLTVTMSVNGSATLSSVSDNAEPYPTCARRFHGYIV